MLLCAAAAAAAPNDDDLGSPVQNPTDVEASNSSSLSHNLHSMARDSSSVRTQKSRLVTFVRDFPRATCGTADALRQTLYIRQALSVGDSRLVAEHQLMVRGGERGGAPRPIALVVGVVEKKAVGKVIERVC